jgi:chromosome partitioning protein
VDTDRQITASNWVDRRNASEGLSQIHCAEKHGNVFHALRDLSERYAEVIVDAGGRDSEELRTALVAAHILYVPLRASQPDLETSVHMNELVTLARGMNPALEARLVISMAPTNPVINEAEQARELLQELPAFKMSDVIIRDRKVYRDAMSDGRGVIEMDNPKASFEIEALAREIYGA